ncbi:MAG TPA: PAS domain-containing protein, partial [Telluria sp.]|nr:PAS domain-containing protein [Telluria sp.]
MPSISRDSLPSIRSKTATLVLACALPTLIGFGSMAYDFYQHKRRDILLDAERSAASLILAVDRDLQNGETAPRALASSPSLAGADLAAFHAQARSVLRPGFPAVGFVLSGPGARPLLDTRVPYGGALPPNANAESVIQVFASSTARTSGLYRADPTQPYLLSIDVPVRRGAAVAYVLSVQFQTGHLEKLLADQRLPAGWIGQVFDQREVIVARNLNAARTVGGRARPQMAARVRQSASGVLELVSREGIPIYSVFSRSPVSGWFVSVGVPQDAARQTLFDALAKMLAGVAALLAVGFLTAWIIGGAIGRSVRALCAPAAALGRGEPLDIPPPRIREAAEVGAALRQVEGELLRYRTGLETLVAARTEQLTRSTALLETVFASAPVGLCFFDRDLRCVMINDYLAAINGKPVADHIGHTLPELLGEVGAEFERNYRKVLADGCPIIGFEISGALPAAPAVERHWIVSYYPVFGPDQRIVGVTGVVLDISERIAAEATRRATGAQLEQSERFIRTLTDNLPGMVGYWDAELRCGFANRLYLDFFRRQPYEMLGQLMQDVMHDDLLAQDAPHVLAALDGKPQAFGRELVTAAGELRHTWANYIPDVDQGGEVRGFYVLISDISALKQGELRLQELNEQLV